MDRVFLSRPSRTGLRSRRRAPIPSHVTTPRERAPRVDGTRGNIGPSSGLCQGLFPNGRVCAFACVCRSAAHQGAPWSGQHRHVDQAFAAPSGAIAPRCGRWECRQVFVLDQLLSTVPVLLCPSLRASIGFPHAVGALSDSLLPVRRILVVLVVGLLRFDSVGHGVDNSRSMETRLIAPCLSLQMHHLGPGHWSRAKGRRDSYSALSGSGCASPPAPCI
jgi:hypothetical protein